jgi:YfiH family protein
MTVLESGIGHPYRVVFSTRQGGVSEGCYRSLNLGLLTDDEPTRVFENRRRLCEAVGADPSSLTMVWQQHGARVVEAGPTGIAAASTLLERCDGVWSQQPRQAMALLTADCLPVALYRTGGPPVLGLLHVGWRGLLAGIVEAGVAAVRGETRLQAVVGPGIGPCCYRVGEEVARAYRAAFGDDVLLGDRLDLWAATERALLRAGCNEVRRLDLCTSCKPELFFSHRRDEGRTGRQGVIGFVE